MLWFTKTHNNKNHHFEEGKLRTNPKFRSQSLMFIVLTLTLGHRNWFRSQSLMFIVLTLILGHRNWSLTPVKKRIGRSLYKTCSKRKRIFHFSSLSYKHLISWNIYHAARAAPSNQMSARDLLLYIRVLVRTSNWEFKGELKAEISNFSNVFFVKSNISEVNFVKLFSLVYFLLRENYVRSWIFPAFATFLIYGPCALCLGHKWTRKISVRNLQYGPWTWLLRGIKKALHKYALYKIKWQDLHTTPYVYYAYIFWTKLFVFGTGKLKFMYVYLMYGAV